MTPHRANSTAIAYSYSKDGAAIGTDTAGAWTAVASTGVTIAHTDDDKNLIIKVDPAALTADYPYLRVVADPGGSASACEIAINAIVEERYNQSTNLSLVD
jgi:hypothetical protein